MSTDNTLRRRILAVSGPALAIVLVYHLTFYRPLQVALKLERAKLSKIEASIARKSSWEENQIKLAAAEKQIGQLNEELAEAVRSGSHLVSRRDDLRSNYLRSRSPAMVMAETLTLLNRHNLECIDSGPVSVDHDKISEALKPVAELLGGVAPAESSLADRREMKIKLRGRFQDMQSALSEMQVAPLSIFTVSLEMEVSDAYSDQRIWILTIAV